MCHAYTVAFFTGKWYGVFITSEKSTPYLENIAYIRIGGLSCSVTMLMAITVVTSAVFKLNSILSVDSAHSPHQFPYAPTAWSECRRLSLEFRELSSAILSGKPRVNVQPSPSSAIIATGWEERLEGTYTVAAVNFLQKPM